MPWYLLWPDLHRLVIVNLQDARAYIKIKSGKTPCENVGEVLVETV